MSNDDRRPVPVPLVGLAAWLVPGLGYWLIGHRARGLVVGATILLLFLGGLLVGGIRVVDPPGYGDFGYKTQIVAHPLRDNRAEVRKFDPASPDEEVKPPSKEGKDFSLGWTLTQQPLAEIGNKPWFVGQILAGPVTLLFSKLALVASHPRPDADGPGRLVSRVAASHSRSWEIGTLYTAVAGMLNLLAIIDACFRAGAAEEA